MSEFCGYFVSTNRINTYQRQIDTSSIHYMSQILSTRNTNATQIHIQAPIAVASVPFTMEEKLFNYGEPISYTLVWSGVLRWDEQLSIKSSGTGAEHKLIALYETYGLDMFQYLNGSFSFMLYDHRREKLICARDHAGTCPLYYTIQNNYFIFATNIKSILQFTGIEKRVNLIALDQLFTFPAMISPQTLFDGIYSIPSAHYLIYEKGEIQQKEYWDASKHIINSYTSLYSEHEYAEILYDYLHHTIRKYIVPDVSYGYYVSGGLGSSLINTILKSNIHELSLPSFSLIDDITGLSEEKYQKVTVNDLNSIHHVEHINNNYLFDNLERLVYHSEAAVNDLSSILFLFLSDMAGDHGVNTVCSSFGSDELFGGHLEYIIDKTYTNNNYDDTMVNFQEEKDIRKSVWNREDFKYYKNFSTLSRMKKYLYSNKVKDGYDSFNCLNHSIIDCNKITAMDKFSLRSYADIKLLLSEKILTLNGGKLQRANSVNVLHPLLDKKVMEFCLQMPKQYKLNKYTRRYILHTIAKRYLPQITANRPKYSHITPRLQNVFSNNMDAVLDLLSSSRIRRQGYFNPTMVEKIKRSVLDAKSTIELPYDADYLTVILTFGIFLDKFNMPDA